MTGLPFILLFIAATMSADPTSRPAPPKSSRVGDYSTSFVDAHDLSSQREAQKRFRWHEKPQPFNLADETFQIHVPENYQPDGSWGVFVWVSPMKTGQLPRMWVDSLAEHKLIWIGADNSENERHIDHRCRMAVEAALHMIDLYDIDRRRVYIGGFSGGGKIAAMTAANYTEIFTGAVSICGPLFYRNIATGMKQGEFYPQGYYPAPPKMMQTFKNATRHVLLTGDNDFNLQPTRQIFELGYVKDKFKLAELIVVPGLAHELPKPDWFEKCVEFLDRPLAATTRPATND
jgi:predicted esterase